MAKNIRVFARIRPSKRDDGFILCGEDGKSLQFHVPREASDLFDSAKTDYGFQFAEVFPQQTKQETVYDRVAADAVNSALDGYNACIFAYGQTGSGKTYSITGGSERYDERGLIPRALEAIFRAFDERADRQYVAHVSFLEIYNDVGYDLLDPRHSGSPDDPLQRVSTLTDEDGNVHLRNLSMHPVSSEQDGLRLLYLGDTNRAISETEMNPNSSRSHCVFTVSVEARQAGSDTIRRSKLHLVDLAGSERVHKTRARAQQFREAVNINTSLHYLQMVIVALHEQARRRKRKGGKGAPAHVPFRNSMLTTVLKDSLGGNSLTSMLATLSPDRAQTGESISTCSFAQRVAHVKTSARVNEVVDPEVELRRLREKQRAMEEEMEALRQGGSGHADADGDDAGPLGAAAAADVERGVRRFLDPAAEATELFVGARSWKRFQAAARMLRDMVRAAQGEAAELRAAMGEAAASEAASAEDGAVGVVGALSQVPPATHGEGEGLGRAERVRRRIAGLEGDLARVRARLAEAERGIQARDSEIKILVRILKRGEGSARGADRGPPSPDGRRKGGVGGQARPVMNAWAAGDGAGGDGGSGSTDAERRETATDVPAGVTEDEIRDRQRAFKLFRRQHDSWEAVESNKDALRRKIEAAKRVSEGVRAAREAIRGLKARLDRVRVARAVDGIGGAPEGGEGGTGPAREAAELAAEEQQLTRQITAEKEEYKAGFARLRVHEREIGSIKAMLERLRERLHRDFDVWHGKILSALGPAAGADMRSDRGAGAGGEGGGDEGEAEVEAEVEVEMMPPPARAPPRRAGAQGTVAEPRSSTGDEEVDEDIAAFYRAKAAFMERTRGAAGR